MKHINVFYFKLKTEAFKSLGDNDQPLAMLFRSDMVYLRYMMVLTRRKLFQRKTYFGTTHGSTLLKHYIPKNCVYVQYMFQVHRDFFLVGVAGWLHLQLAFDIVHNRTVNRQGGLGKNQAMDRVCEFLNAEFKCEMQRIFHLTCVHLDEVPGGSVQ